MSNTSGELVESLAIEIYKCFLGFVPHGTPQLLAEYSARAMTVAAIDKALIEGVLDGLPPETILQRLLNSLRRDEYMPDISTTIH